jgi:hypothetical protein
MAERGISIRLSLEDRDDIRRRLEQLGASGDQAASRLRQAFDKVPAGADAAARSVGQVGQSLRLVGFQLNDVVVQLQSGQNPFVVLSQQGAQLGQMLPGVAGAVAGIGIALAGVAAKTLLSAEAAETAAEAEKRYRSAIEATNAVLLTRREAEARKKEEALKSAIEGNEAALKDAEAAARRAADELRQFQDLLTPGKTRPGAGAGIAAYEAELRRLEQAAVAANQRVRELIQARDDLGTPGKQFPEENEQRDLLEAEAFNRAEAAREKDREAAEKWMARKVLDFETEQRKLDDKRELLEAEAFNRAEAAREKDREAATDWMRRKILDFETEQRKLDDKRDLLEAEAYNRAEAAREKDSEDARKWLLKKQQDEAGQAEERARKERERAAERAGDRIVDLAADGFARLAEHGKDAFRDVGDFALTTFRSVFAQLASEQLVKPLAQQLVSAFQSFAGGIPGGGFVAGGVALAGLAATSLFGGSSDARSRREAEKQRQAQAATQAAQAALAEAAAASAAQAQAQAQAAQEMDLAARRSLAELRGDTAASFQLLLEDNARRLDEAREAGANIALIEAENAALRRRHLAGLADAEFQALGQATTALERFDRAVQSLTRSLDDEISRRVQAAGEEARAAAQAARDYGQLAQSLRRASFDLRGGDLSTLGPADRLQQQRGEFARLSQLAGGGDKDALGRLPEAARAFLEASRDFNATTEAYARDFAAVQMALDRAAEQAGDLAQAANYQAELVDLQEQVLAAIRDTLGQARIDSDLLKRQAEALEAVEATLQGTRRVTTQALGEAVDQSAIQDVLKGLTGEQKAAVEGVLSQVSQGTSLQGSAVGKLVELVQAVRDQQEDEARRRADEERRRAEEEARQAALRAQRQAAVSAARAATGNINLPSNVGEGGITVSNAGGRFFLSLLNSGLAGDYMRTVVSQLNSLIDSLGVTLQPFNPLTWTNTTVNPQSLFNQLLAYLGLSGFAAGGVMTPRGPLDLNGVGLRRYAGGGVADRPQLALFGEGARNEAFVPLPDGRSIPVSLRLAGNDNAAVVAALRWHAGATAAAIVAAIERLAQRIDRLEASQAQAARLGSLGIRRAVRSIAPGDGDLWDIGFRSRAG